MLTGDRNDWIGFLYEISLKVKTNVIAEASLNFFDSHNKR